MVRDACDKVAVTHICFIYWPQDVEGYVPLSIVAQFQRMQQITNDLELLRQISRNSDTLTFDVANDTGQCGIIFIFSNAKYERIGVMKLDASWYGFGCHECSYVSILSPLTVRLKEDWKKWLWPTAEGVMGVPLWTKVSDEVMMEMLPSTSRSLVTVSPIPISCFHPQVFPSQFVFPYRNHLSLH